ncbi:DEAD/DEAH box helicase family protein [Mesorhizobium sp. LCM 4577]|uniref:DEAD/DEAH box helicase family protein n=1 Tax=Mesorhizobium sp. LCM 4577 TaxID=1848288 RepID=UPI001FCD7D7D
MRKDGHIRLVTSVELKPDDLVIIQRHEKSRKDLCAERLERIIDEEFRDGVGPGVERLARLLDLGRLHIKIAMPRYGAGIYHEKVGVFLDGNDYVAFTGSANESRYAFEENCECIEVYPSWAEPRRAARKYAHFDAIWHSVDDSVETLDFPDAVRRQLLRKVEEHRAKANRPVPIAPDPEWKWRHQRQAAEEFIRSERGVLNMATGTGKTKTALRIARILVDLGKVDTILVTTDGTDLLKQWRSELLGLRAELPGFHVFSDFEQHREVQEFALAPIRAILLVSRLAMGVRDPLAAAMRSLTLEEKKRTLLIHDEVHKLGSPSNRARLTGLSDGIRFRLGLSATPEREYDQEGNDFIVEHVGPEIFRFELEDAIRRGILAPFDYHPLRYHLTADDRERLRDVYRRKAARAAAGEPMSEQEVWTELARVYKTSEAKLPAFRDSINDRPELLRRCIIFVETIEYATAVLEIVHSHRPDFHTYFGGEDSDTLRRFARGELECLITCHRLSEGIDIQSLSSVVLFSSARARLETIQRMGRCLRVDPNVPDKIANVVDFVREHDPDAIGPSADEDRFIWLSQLATVRFEEDAQ